MSKKLHCYYCGKFLAIIEEGKISPKLIPVCEDCRHKLSGKISTKDEDERYWRDYFDKIIFGKNSF